MCAWLKPASCQQDFFNPAIIFGNSLKVYFCLEPTNTTGAHSRQGVPETTEQQQSGFWYQLRRPKFLRWTSAQATRFASFVVTYTDSTHRGEMLSGMPTCIAATSRSPEDISSGSLHVWDLWLFPPRQSPQAVTHHFLSSPFLREARLPALQPAGPTQPTDTKKTLVDVLKLWAGRCNLNIENTATKNINRSYLRLLKTDFFFPPFRLRSPKHAAASTTLVLVH